ncbi:MAG: pentapeptide repeat-containing protein, partial [Planctomycetota bacterium]|nr:pentapeptide repeat-containing protein [Planctomycetota bacterium]
MDTIQFKNGTGPAKAQRCGYCHDDFGVELAAFCPLCDSRLHLDCLAELQRCPTLGCSAEFKRSDALPPVTEETRARRQRFLELRARELHVAPSLIRRDGSETGMTLGQHLQEFPADFTGVEFPGIDLRRYELEGGVFVEAWMKDGNFSGARMPRSQFQGAHLESTDFRHALV